MATKPTSTKARAPGKSARQQALADIDTTGKTPAEIAALAEQTAGIKPRNKVSSAVTKNGEKAAKNTGRDKKTVQSTKKKSDPNQKNWDGTTERPQGKTITKPTGRPSDYNKELADRICGELADGRSLRDICRDDDMPSAGTVCRWLSEKKEFSEQYRVAREAQADVLFDEILHIADDGKNDSYVDDEGIRRTDYDVVARSKLRVHARQWMIGKMKPKVYGEKLDLNHGGQPDNPVLTQTKVVLVPAKESAQVETRPMAKDPE